MKTHYIVFYSLLITLFSSFEIREECQYAESNMGFIQTQTRKAITATTVNQSHYIAYKALKEMQKTENLVEDCGCTDAFDFIKSATENLKMATRATTLEETRKLLNISLENTIAGAKAIAEYIEINGSYGTDVLAMNTVESNNTINKPTGAISYERLKEKIDISLISYEASLQTVVETIECKEAYAFAKRIYDHCETELLKDNLSEGKKYYNLRTKAITKEALDLIGECSK
ncbi:hypothetical protein JQC67_09465 [Aurantibacter crassamenti]|uniref:hypothetical protein n=1 Tax=Aurantibacter crassamenti TaxID=1837375 RepID=UPI00193A20DD|nr:hypothetical protein [Aurantibacter crassamenti]MBM1106363.1 hypothetical protein [Aurantibacter crassamenti]